MLAALHKIELFLEVIPLNVILSDFKKYKKSLEKGENKVISLKKGGYKNLG